MNFPSFAQLEDDSYTWRDIKRNADGSIDFASGIKKVKGDNGFSVPGEYGGSTISTMRYDTMSLSELDPERAKIVQNIWVIAYHALTGNGLTNETSYKL